MTLENKTTRLNVIFIPHAYADGSAWLGIESTDGKVLPACADSFFGLDLKEGMTLEDAVWLASVLNEKVAFFGQTRMMSPASDRLM